MTNLFDRFSLALRARCARSSVVSRQSSVAEDQQHPLQLTTDHGPRTPSPSSRRPVYGLTLIEMLVALAVTLVMMAAVVNLFANISGSIRNRRAAIETGAQLRQVRQRLAMDLNGATCRGTTWQRPEANQGYIEIIEGEWSDKNPSSLILPANVNTANGINTTISLVPSSQAFDPDTGSVPGGDNIGVGAITDGRALGDWDDVLALTVRSESEPFTAEYRGAFVESPLAEVVWFATEQGPSTPADPNDGMRRVYRKVLLIAPWLDNVGGAIANPPANISAHWDPSRGCWVANTLGDLTKRENRAFREPDPLVNLFPHRVDLSRVNNSANSETLVLANALAFDLRVFDQGAPLYASGSDILEPNDLGWANALATAGIANASGYGAYCDLGWGFDPDSGTTGAMVYLTIPPNAPVPDFNNIQPAGYHPRSSPQSNSRNMYPAVYDTWSYHYENDGINQDDIWQTNALPWQRTTIDQGANGLDDDGVNGVDDRGERETAPPYDVPLRGLKAILRVYEPDARQVRESSVTHSFNQ